MRMDIIGAGILAAVLLLGAGCPNGDDDDANADDTVADDDDATSGAAPIVYFVVHADPADLQSIKSHDAACSDFDQGDGRWDRLVDLMDAVDARNAARPEDAQHRITLMFTPGWAALLATSPCATQAQARLAGWVQAGHEIALHSHSQTHVFRDGYSNEPAWVRDDRDGGAGPSDCVDAPAPQAPDPAWLQTCSIDRGLADLEAALEAATGSPYDIRWGRIGPEGNSTDPEDPNPHATSCTVAGTTLPAGQECAHREWVGDVAARVDHTTLAYPVDHCGRDAVGALHGVAACRDWGDGGSLFGIPHAPLRTESGELRVSIERLADDLRRADGDLVGVVVHPNSYTSEAFVDRTFCSDPYEVADRRAYIDAVFDLFDGEAISLGGGSLASNAAAGEPCDCTVAPQISSLSLDALSGAVTSVTLSEARAAWIAAGGADCD